jgi:RNA polymerase sigma factor (sigma-70 family)
MTTDNLTDLALRAGQGDELALNELLPKITIIAKGIAAKEMWYSTYEDREDMVQEILYKCWQSLSTFQYRTEFVYWFNKLARNIIITHYRKMSRVKRVPVFISKDTEEFIDPDISLMCEEYLTLCPENNQQAMMLYAHSYTWDEASEKIGLDKANLRSRHRRGIEIIQKKGL